jgi:hypothetical protein
MWASICPREIKMPKRTDVPISEVVSQIPRAAPVQDVFGWTVPVEQVPLPSAGLIYPKGSPLHGRETLQIKAMTAQEEDILMSRALWKEGTVTTHLIKSCLIDKSVNPAELLSGDRNALLVSIRITGYGTDYRATATCPACSKSDSYTFDLSQIGIKRMGSNPVAPGANEFEFVLPVSKKRVVFKLLTVQDEDDDRIAKERMQRLFPDANQNNPVTRQLENQVISIDGKTDRTAIAAFIKVMPAADSRALRTRMRDTEPGLDMQLDMECRSCGVESKVALPLGAAFFWPE